MPEILQAIREKLNINPNIQTGKGAPRPLLIVTATQVETQAILDEFSPGKKIIRQIIDHKTYYPLGWHGSQQTVPVYLVQSQMGTATVGGAEATVMKAIQSLNPQTVILSGIAFGMKKDKHELGDILISTKIFCYEPQKMTIDGEIPRGERVSVSEALLDRFQSGDIGYDDIPKRHFGLIVTGEKLVNDPLFLEQLREKEPEAIGGEMEAAGLYVAAHDKPVNWIVVKAICDWADGTKNDDAQATAACNAARFVHHVIDLYTWQEAKEDGKDSGKGCQVTVSIMLMVAVVAAGFYLIRYTALSALFPAARKPTVPVAVVGTGTPAKQATSTSEAAPTFPPLPSATVYPITTPVKAPSPPISSAPGVITLENVANVRNVFTLHDAVALAWSPDNRYLAVSTGRGIHLYDTATLEQVRTFASGQSFSNLAFYSNGLLLAYDRDLIVVWDVSTGGQHSIFESHRNVDGISISKDGSLLAIHSGEAIILADAGTGREIRTLTVGATQATPVFSPDGRWLASAGGVAGQDIFIIDVTTGQTLRTLHGHSNWIMDLAFSADGSRLASAGVDNSVILWDPSSGLMTTSLEGHTGQVDGVSFSPDGGIVATISWDLTVRLWNAANGQLLKTLTGHTGWGKYIAFSPNGRYIASLDGMLIVWGLEP